VCPRQLIKAFNLGLMIPEGSRESMIMQRGGRGKGEETEESRGTGKQIDRDTEKERTMGF